jgi:WD40 repeat protein/tRNA A-37 threonylcarbamoyl transferase component Bud32
MSETPAPRTPLPLELRRRADQVCDRFEAAWRAGRRPSLREHLPAPTDPLYPTLLRELVLLEIFYRRRHGESPAPLEYARRFPRLTPDWLAAACAPRLPEAAPSDVGVSTSHGEQGGPVPTEVVPGPGGTLGGYEILEELGRGGMGVVYKARQRGTNRVVALKMILAEQLASAGAVQRFRAEAETVAGLDHPHIVPVYEVGEDQGRHFFSMKLVEGGHLGRHLPRYAADPRAAALLLAQVARAVHHAHQRGLLHRDLKPQNILLERQPGDGHFPVPHVTDFGLARKIEGEGGLTQSGAIVGTPEYMAPEQATAQKVLTTAVDIYGLGAVLYALLTGQPPFRGEHVLQTLQQVVGREPSPPRGINRRLPRDLETVCLKCLAKEPQRRYATAAALAEDLERWLRGEPIAARPVGAAERAWKWAKRRPAVAGLLAAVVLAILGGLGGMVWYARDAEQALRDKLAMETDRGAEYRGRIEALGREKEALGREKEALEGWRKSAYYNWLALAHNEYRANNLVRADEMLSDGKKCPEDLRNFEWYYLKRLCHSELSRFQADRPAHLSNGQYGRSLAPDAGRLAVVNGPTLDVYDTAAGKKASTSRVGGIFATPLIKEVALSPDGKLLATSSHAQEHDVIFIQDVATGANLARLYGLKKTYWRPFGFCGAAFSPDGRLVAGTDNRGNLFVWDLDAGWGRLHATPAALLGQSVGAGAVAAGAPLGPMLLTVGALVAARSDPFAPQDYQNVLRARWWENLAETEADPFRPRFRVLAHPVANPAPNSTWHTKPAFSPDGKLVATASADGEVVKLWDVQTGKEEASLGKAAGFAQAVFSPKGKWVAAIGSYEDMVIPDRAVWVWDAKTHQSSRVLRGQGKTILCLAFSPNEQLLATGSRDGTLTLWDLRTGQEVSTYRGHEGGVLAAAFSPDGRRVVTLDGDDVVRTWDATRPSEYLALGCRGAWQAAFSGDGRRIAAAAKYRTADVWGTVVWDAESGRELAQFGDGTESAQAVALSPDGSLVAAAVTVGTTNGMVRVWDVRTGQLVRNRSQAHLLAQVIGAEAVAPAGAPAGGAMGPLLLRLGAVRGTNWDAFGLVRNLPAQGPAAPCDAVAWSADGKWIASGGQDRVVRVWDAATGKQVLALGGHARTISAVAFSHDGKRLASASGGITRRWPALQPNPLKVPSDRAEDVPDVKIWDVATGQELRSWSLPAKSRLNRPGAMPIGNPGKAPGLALSPDGETVAVPLGETGIDVLPIAGPGGRSQVMSYAYAAPYPDVVRLSRVATGAEVAVLKGHTRPPWCVAFSPDGQRVVTGGGDDETIKLWDAATGEEIMTVGRHPGNSQVTGVAFSPDGMKILSTNSSAEVRVWDATPLTK